MSDATLPPNPHLYVDGIPPVPQALVDAIAPYTAFAPTELVAWHPMRRALLVARRDGATPQLHLIDAPMTAGRPLTDFADPVTRAAFEPVRGECLVFARDSGGDEVAQLHRLDLADGRTTRLTDASMKHGDGVWNHRGDALVVASVLLDRHASGVDRPPVQTTLSIIDAAGVQRIVTLLPGTGWDDFHWSPDDRTLYAIERRSVIDSRVWTIDAETGARRQLLPLAEQVGPVAFTELNVSRDGRSLVYASDQDGEFAQLMTLDLETGARRCLTRYLPWDVQSVALDGDRVAVVVNVAARHALHLFDLVSGDEIALPGLPPAARTGSVSRVRFSTVSDEIAFTVASARSPGDVYAIDLTTQACTVWSRAEVAGLDTTRWREAEVVTWPSFDGLAISGLVSRPPARFTGRRPVLIHIHGGPESQAVIGFLGANNWFLDALGIAYIQPNVRGSTGYGKTFVSRDDGIRRQDSVMDIGALFDWIATQPDLDADRVLVAGRSYGGFMSLAVATTYAPRLVASIAIVAISHFTSFLERTESYRRDLRRVEYGDERDPAIRAFFEQVSPLSNADRIAKPLLVVAGRNDPRVPYQEGEQIVAKVKANGVPIWHLVADDEGHVFTRKPNTDFVFYAQALFVQRYLFGTA